VNQSARREEGHGRHRLTSAVEWFWIAILGSVLGLALLGIDIAWRAADQDLPAAIYLERLRLPEAALVPAGSPVRRPDAIHSGIDLRFSPWLPQCQAPAQLPLFLDGEREKEIRRP
jgi:hypothetical protein